MEEHYTIARAVAIAPGEFRFRFSRSGGPGGQNVNKVSSRVELLFDVAHSSSLPRGVRDLLCRKLAGRIDEDGVLHVVVDRSRSQWQNREIAVRKTISLLQAALVPRRARIPTHASRASRAKRREAKAAHGQKKRLRKPPGLDG